MVHSLGHKLLKCLLPVFGVREITELPFRISNGNTEFYGPKESYMKISRSMEQKIRRTFKEIHNEKLLQKNPFQEQEHFCSFLLRIATDNRVGL